MTEQSIKEQISLAYVRAIASNAGIGLERYENDYGMDGKFIDYEYDSVEHRHSPSGFGIDFQIKATINIIPKDGYVLYDLEAKNYRDLIKTAVGCPRVLVVYSMPQNREDWLRVSNDNTIFRYCAWWCSLKGASTEAGKFRKRIRIPDNQRLNCDELRRLIGLVKEGVEL